MKQKAGKQRKAIIDSELKAGNPYHEAVKI
jgi:hypothetical protein